MIPLDLSSLLLPTFRLSSPPPALSTVQQSHHISTMYITSDLFGSTHSTTHGQATPWSQRPTMTDSSQGGGLGKRKRSTADDTPSRYGDLHDLLAKPTLTSYRNSHYHTLIPASRGSPSSRMHNNSTFDSRIQPCSHHLTSPTHTSSERRPVKQLKRLPPKSSLVKSTSHLMDIDLELASSVPVAAPQTYPISDLRPCHACQSAPRRKKDLENYLDCRRCDGRTCYICARQCFGGCGKAVCKKCIVEVGEEGDPWCLDCYARKINA